MIGFTVNEVSDTEFDVVLKMTQLDAVKIKKIFNVNLKLAKEHGIVKTSKHASELVGIAFKWFSVIDRCEEQDNTIPIVIPRDSYDIMMRLFGSKGFPIYSYEAGLCEDTCNVLYESLKSMDL